MPCIPPNPPGTPAAWQAPLAAQHLAADNAVREPVRVPSVPHFFAFRARADFPPEPMSGDRLYWTIRFNQWGTLRGSALRLGQIDTFDEFGLIRQGP